MPPLVWSSCQCRWLPPREGIHHLLEDGQPFAAGLELNVDQVGKDVTYVVKAVPHVPDLPALRISLAELTGDEIELEETPMRERRYCFRFPVRTRAPAP
jgi:hypothetical protein